MVSIETLQEVFDDMGAKLDAEVLEKCLELCLKYDIEDPYTFFDRWLAFSVSNYGGAHPTLDTLRIMESKELENCIPIVNKVKDYQLDASITNSTDYNIDDEDYDNVMDSYAPITPKAKKSLPKTGIHAAQDSKIYSSPVSHSPITPSLKHSETSGNIVCTFGSSKCIKNTVWTSTREPGSKLGIQILNTSKSGLDSVPEIDSGIDPETEIHEEDHIAKVTDRDFQFMTGTKSYMYDPTRDRALILGEIIYDIGREICAKSDKNLEDSIRPVDESQDLESDEVEKFQKILQNNVNQPYYQKKVQCLGRIFSKTSKLEKNTTELLGADETKVRRVKLDFSKVQKPVALFPGQTVIVEGSNINGQQFVVDGIHTDRDLHHCPRPTNITKQISLIVASAPFTNSDDLLFEPLTNLIGFCKNNKPDVLILTGPFLDIQSAVLTDMPQSFDEHFEKIVSSVMEAIGPDTEVIIQSSHKDVNSFFVYPTHPYIISEKYPNLHLIPDPCIVDINSLKIGITSTDAIGHLVENELIINNITDKVKRSVNYLFQQKSFYPLMPPHNNTPVDLGLAAQYAKLTMVPHVLLVPSSLKCFIRDVNNCLCINPGHLYEPNGGTYARIVIHPPPNENSTLFEYASGQIVKV